jgi:hypothetical protein
VTPGIERFCSSDRYSQSEKIVKRCGGELQLFDVCVAIAAELGFTCGVFFEIPREAAERPALVYSKSGDTELFRTNE